LSKLEKCQHQSAIAWTWILAQNDDLVFNLGT